MIHTFGAEIISLTEKRCIPCEGGIPPLTEAEIQPLLSQINNEWKVIANHHIERKFKFSNFVEALEFVNKSGIICENEGHHADFELSWGKVNVMIWTHKIDGLTESDFILAAKIDEI